MKKRADKTEVGIPGQSDGAGRKGNPTLAVSSGFIRTFSILTLKIFSDLPVYLITDS